MHALKTSVYAQVTLFATGAFVILNSSSISSSMWSHLLRAAALGVWLLVLFPAQAALAQGAADSRPIAVEAVTAERQPLIEEVPVVGTITPLQQALLSAEVSGLIKEITVDIGNNVHKGDLLLLLDPELNSISRDAALTEIVQAREALADSRRRLSELQSLVGDQHVAETEVKNLASEVRIRDAELQAAQVEAERQSALLRRHRINAPFSGTISQRQVEVGEWVEPGTALFELVASDKLRADFQVPQKYFSRIDPNTDLSVTLDDGTSLNTRVEHKIPVSRDSGRAFLLRTLITGNSDPSTRLIPGMSASATLKLENDRQGVALPRDAVLRYPDGRITVWIADPGGAWGEAVRVQERLVTTGLSFNGLIEIRTGIEAGQRVVVRGNESLQPGQTVILNRAKR